MIQLGTDIAVILFSGGSFLPMCKILKKGMREVFRNCVNGHLQESVALLACSSKYVLLFVIQILCSILNFGGACSHLVLKRGLAGQRTAGESSNKDVVLSEVVGSDVLKENIRMSFSNIFSSKENTAQHVV